MGGRARDHQRPIPAGCIYRQRTYLGNPIANANSVT
jgi:hypothetical protein